ncbi:MAG: hypothetical protein GXP38_01590 [Chloroflexi bacterium]|nr:hypothetical protein [Chloroflexota bacterium]
MQQTVPVFDAGRQLLKVRAMMAAALIVAVVTLYAGIHLAQSYGLNPADGGVLAPLPLRLAWGAGVTLLGLAFAAAMIIYGHCYVARLEVDEMTDYLHIYTISPWLTLRPEKIPRSALKPGRRHRGRTLFIWHPILVNAPWQTLRVQGRRLPLILDEQGEILHRQWIQRLRRG